MNKINHKEARALLTNACERYVSHKKGQLDEIIAESYSYPPDFGEGLEGREEPRQGFIDLARYEYHEMLKSILRVSRSGEDMRLYQRGSLNFLKEIKDKYYLGKLKSYRKKHEDLDQSDPQLLLSNLKALTGIFKCVIAEDAFKLKFKGLNLDPFDDCNEEEPLSLRVDQAINNLKSLLELAKTLPHYLSDECSELAMKRLGFHLHKALPTFDSLLKKIIVDELKSILDDKSLSHKDALEGFEQHLKNGRTLDILGANLQSESEQRWKLYSVISIVFGIGIFTTLGLIAKRFYDSGYTSINFFKPLAQNLIEDIEAVTANISPASKI